MSTLRKALEKIKELEEQLQDRIVMVDLLQEDNDDLRLQLCLAKAQLAQKNLDCRYPDLRVS